MGKARKDLKVGCLREEENSKRETRMMTTMGEERSPAQALTIRVEAGPWFGEEQSKKSATIPELG